MDKISKFIPMNGTGEDVGSSIDRGYTGVYNAGTIGGTETGDTTGGGYTGLDDKWNNRENGWNGNTTDGNNWNNNTGNNNWENNSTENAGTIGGFIDIDSTTGGYVQAGSVTTNENSNWNNGKYVGDEKKWNRNTTGENNWNNNTGNNNWENKASTGNGVWGNTTGGTTTKAGTIGGFVGTDGTFTGTTGKIGATGGFIGNDGKVTPVGGFVEMPGTGEITENAGKVGIAGGTTGYTGTGDTTKNKENVNDGFTFKVCTGGGSSPNLPAKQGGFFSKLKSILFYEIKVELTPHQKKVETEVNDFLNQEVTWKGFKNFLFGDVFGSKKKKGNDGNTNT